MTPRVALIGVACACSACVSPEAVRSRAGGPGADVGNRTAVVKMHEGSAPYWRTPIRITGAHPPLEPATHARELSTSPGAAAAPGSRP